MERLKLGIVYWEDAQSIRKEEELPEKCPIMRSIGAIAKKKDYVLVVSLITPEDGLGGVSTLIPNGCVKRIEWLKNANTK